MALAVNLLGEGDQDLTRVRGALGARNVAAEINAPLSAELPLVVCVAADKGVTPALIEIFRRAEGQQVQLAALLMTGGKAESELVELLQLELVGVLSVLLGEVATDGVRTLKQWKEGWEAKVAKALGKPLTPALVCSPNKSRAKKHGVKQFFE